MEGMKEFTEWFVAQHGQRSGSDMPNHTDAQLRDMVHAGQVAERVLERRRLWDDRRLAALKAWEAQRA
jgi:hypothetical protein